MLENNNSNVSIEQHSHKKESESEELFRQMKKILMLHSEKPLADQVIVENNGLAGANTNNQADSNMNSEFMKILYFLLNKGPLVTFFDAIYSTYNLIYDQLPTYNDETERNVNLGVYESFLEFVFHRTKYLSPLEGHKIGELVYTSLSKYLPNSNLKLSNKTALLLYLIPLVTINQQHDVTDALLDGILYQTNQFIPARKYLSSSLCLGSFLYLLKRNYERKNSSDLISSILLTLISEGIFNS